MERTTRRSSYQALSICRLVKNPAPLSSWSSVTPWGIAIRALLMKVGTSRRKAALKRLAPYSAFGLWQNSRRGPTIATVDRLLTGLGLTWKDWAQAFEQAKRQSATSARRKEQHPLIKQDREAR